MEKRRMLEEKGLRSDEMEEQGMTMAGGIGGRVDWWRGRDTRRKGYAAMIWKDGGGNATGGRDKNAWWASVFVNAGIEDDG